MNSWPKWAWWVASVWLISSVLSLVIAACLALFARYDLGSTSFGYAGLTVVSLGGAVLIRLHWHSIRSWSTKANDWLLDHPATTVGIYVLMGMCFSLSLGLSPVNLAFGGALWGAGGWWNVSRDRRRRGGAAA